MSKNTKTELLNFLENFGYESPKVTQSGMFRYEVSFSDKEHRNRKIPIDFYYISDDSELFEIQEKIWNKNEVNYFIAVTDNQSIIYNGKMKPNKEKPQFAKINSFQYGIKEQSDDYPQILRKEKLDGGYFFEFVINKRKRNREQEVDKDLLLNLIALRQDMLQVSDDSSTIHLLILRCLFLKYLEDRGIFEKDYLLNILETGTSQNLVQAFSEVSKINGDIFKYDKLKSQSIHSKYLDFLALFFKTDYRNRQQYLFFPYRFDYIPIQLISNVYEAFLNAEKKKGKGIYYTPKFVVDFMLSQTFNPLLEEKKEVTLFDPACGSGAFLVEGFKNIVKSRNAEKDFSAKVDILKNQIFGIDIDAKALQIATFSLYLALLEGLDPVFVKEQIKHRTPILPSLIGKNLLQGNSLIDKTLFEEKTFDCIVANPPWGSVPNLKANKNEWEETDFENEKERLAIGGKGKKGAIPLYENVSDFQRSQAFLLKVKKWSSATTTYSLIVNNSIFLNENADGFRNDLLNSYHIKNFYELSHLNKILFRKKSIGKINGKSIEIGATEPCAVLIFENIKEEENLTKYTSPKLNLFSEELHLIHYSEYDVKTTKQEDLRQEDLLWRVFVNGNWDDYQLIKQKYYERDKTILIECRSGFQPKRNMRSIGNPELRSIIHPSDFYQYFLKENLDKFNWNQNLRRRPKNIFSGDRILLSIRPLKGDSLKLKSIRINENQVFKDDILSVKIKKNGEYSPNHSLYLAILNSSFSGYCNFHIAMQWGKGGLKRSTLRNGDIEKFPFPIMDSNENIVLNLFKLVQRIEKEKQQQFQSIQKIKSLEQQLDDLVFDLYDLTEYEKSLVREFYDINVHRNGKEVNRVRPSDLAAYFEKFREVFESIFEDNMTIEGRYKISPNLGAYIVIQVKEKTLITSGMQQSDFTDDYVFHTLKKKQLEQTFYTNRLSEQKTKVYEADQFFIIKSHFYKDWTVRQAIDDANEEIRIFMQETNT